MTHQSLMTSASLPHSFLKTSRIRKGFSETCVPFTRLYLPHSTHVSPQHERPSQRKTYAVMKAQGFAYFSASMNGMR